MVTRRHVHRLMILQSNFEWLRISCLHAGSNHHDCPVKGEKFILSCFETNLPIIKNIAKEFETLKDFPSFTNKWIKYLKVNYGPGKKKNLPTNISMEDANKLHIEIKEWMDKLTIAYSNDGTVLLTDQLLTNFIKSGMIKKLDKFERHDLIDGLSCLRNLIPTPAAMILLRVCERILQKYYKKITGKQSGKKTWGGMLKVLTKNSKTDRALIGYLNYLNSKRIDALHPYKQYEQEDAERIFLHLRDLLEAVYSRKRR